MAKLKTELSGKGSNIRVERAYAKSIGVKSPTTLTKAQLDEAVRQRELELGITKEKHNIYDFTFAERQSLVPQVSVKTRIQMFTGYFKPFPEGDGVLRRDPFEAIPETDAYVSGQLVEEFGMLPGDRVVGNVCVVSYNHVRVLKNVRYLNEESTTRPIMRKPFEELADVRVSSRLKIYGNNALLGVIQDVLCLGQGQSLVISGVCEGNAEYLEQTAADLVKGLYMTFDGNVFGLFEDITTDCRYALSSVVNPETMMIDGDRDEYDFMLSMLKRSVERKVPAVIVIYAPDYPAEEFLTAAKAAKDGASLTVIKFGREDGESQAKIVFEGNEIIVDKLSNSMAAYVCGQEKHRQIFRAVSGLKNGAPDNVLTMFTELMHE